MNRADLLHLIRAACDLLEVDEVLVLGSQAILATRSEDELPDAATRSREADIAAWSDPDESCRIACQAYWGRTLPSIMPTDTSLTVSAPTPLCFPLNWRQRAIRLESYSVVRNQSAVGVCPEAGDLCVSKLCALREKDLDFVSALLHEGIVDHATLRDRLDTVPGIDPVALARAQGWLSSLPDAPRWIAVALPQR